MQTLIQDIRYGARRLGKAPGFTVIAVLTLALGIGANTAIFSVVYGALLRPLPYPQPQQLVQISISYNGQLDYSGFTAREFHFWQEHSAPFAALAATTARGFNLTGGSEPVRVRAMRVSSGYFNVMGVQPALGRSFSAVEDTPAGPLVVVVSYGLWKSHLGGDPQLIGRNISLDGASYTVIGIMPDGFASVPAADVWITIAPVDQSVGSGLNYQVIGRLKEGITREQADAYLDSVRPSFLQEFRKHEIYESQRPRMGFHATPMVYMMSLTYRTALWALFGAIGFVLLIACVNVANLLLARAASRTREIAVRTALGAGRMRIVRQLLTESLLLALMGGALGLLLAYWGLNPLLALAPADLPRAQDIALDRWALGFSFLVSLFSGILFGVAPAFQISKTDLAESLKESSGRTSSGVGRQRTRSTLVVSEVALSLILLAGASLLIETFSNLLRVNSGFDPRPILSVQIWPTELQTTGAMVNFHRNVLERISRIPGVQAAAMVVGGLPLERGGNEYFTFPGQRREDGISADYREITPDYFRALGVPLQQGRFFTTGDSHESRHVSIVNEELAREYFAREGAVGQHIQLEANVDLEIVGVVGNVKSFLNEQAPPTVFIPDSQADIGSTKGFMGWFPGSILVRTRPGGQNPLSVSHEVTDAIRGADSRVPIGKVQSMEEVLSTALAFQKFLMTLMSMFAGLAIILAAVGIYGVMAFSVAQRTHEIGVRVALGARSSDVWRMVLSRGMLLTFAGIVVGLAGAYGLTRLLADQLYGVKPADPLVLTMAAAALALVALLACWIPARRATRVDPLVALRYE